MKGGAEAFHEARIDIAGNPELALLVGRAGLEAEDLGAGFPEQEFARTVHGRPRIPNLFRRLERAEHARALGNQHVPAVIAVHVARDLDNRGRPDCAVQLRVDAGLENARNVAIGGDDPGIVYGQRWKSRPSASYFGTTRSPAKLARSRGDARKPGARASMAFADSGFPGERRRNNGLWPSRLSPAARLR